MTPTEIVLGTKGLTKAFESEGAPVRALRRRGFVVLADEARDAPGVLSGGHRQRLAPSPGRWPTSQRWCWPTNQPAPSTPRAARKCSSCSARLDVGGQSILMVTQDQDVADAGNRIVRMKDGRVDPGTAAPARMTAGAVSA
jgi:putative ABC transport system ATP-binding protein